MQVLDQPAIPFLSEAELLESGEAAASERKYSDSSRLVIGSYNIRYAVGQRLISSGIFRKLGFNFPGQRPTAVANNIRLIAEALTQGAICPPLDVLALQEADKATARSGGHHVAAELAERLGMSWVHAPAGIPRGQLPKTRAWWLDFEEQIGLNDQGDTGVALLSRLPLNDVTRIDLPWTECPWRPRVAVAATIQLGARRIRILNAHIDPHSAIGGQIEQLEVVLKEAERFSGPVALLGDFNTLSKQKCLDTRRLIESRGFTTPFPTGTPTWRGSGIRLHADWAFVRNAGIGRWGVARPLSASDHWPIWAEVEVS